MWKYQELLRNSPHELDRLHSAALNLACAHGLPGTEHWDIKRCFARISDMAERVRWKTVRNFTRFERDPQAFRSSRPYFRALVLVDTRQRDYGIRYNPSKIPETAILCAEDLFAYGPVMGAGGTCASLPVVYAAVGQRLGYPIRLVTAKTDKWTHLFVRWDGDGARFNIETTAAGFVTDPDDHYRTAPYSVTPQEERDGGFLQSATPRQEMALYLVTRAHCHLDSGSFRGAADALAWASALWPQNACFRHTLAKVLNDWQAALAARIPSDFPTMQIAQAARRYPGTLRLRDERDLIGLEATENLLNTRSLDKRLWQPLREGHRVPCPSVALAEIAADGSCNIRLKFGGVTDK